MPKASGYVRFKVGWSEVGFTDHWGVPYPKGCVYIEMGPTVDRVAMSTIANNVSRTGPIITLKRGKVYPFTLKYFGGAAHGIIAGVDLGTLPAPTVELPFMVSNADYYPNWWDVPEHREATISTVLPTAIGVGLIKFIK